MVLGNEVHQTPDLCKSVPCAIPSSDIFVFLQRWYSGLRILGSSIHSNRLVEAQLPKGEIKLSTVSLCLLGLAELLLPDECRLWLASCVA
jgi:hypothetical protein